MATLTLKSYEQILGSMFTTVLANLGINDITPGSVLETLLSAAANEDFEQYVQMVNIIQNYNLDTTTGTNLDNRAFEFGIQRKQPVKASGFINIKRPAGFVKVSTSFYSGFPSPIVGNTTIFVNDASSPLFGTSGSLILGRGTSDQEVVTYSSAPVNHIYYWSIVVSPLANNHTFSETVILSQGGDKLISAGTLIQVPATGTSPQLVFSTNTDVTLLDGEEEVDNVIVTAQLAGSIGNIPVNAINGTQAFISAPFTGAQAVNTARFTTGQDLESDEALRNRIKAVIQALSRGVETAIINGVTGLTDPTSAQTVVSTSVILPTTPVENVQVFIDNGVGFEPTFKSQGFEAIFANASGGEKRFQVDFAPIVKAQVVSQSSAPFNMTSISGLTLSYTVGISSETITFVNSDFQFPSFAQATEIVNAINSKATLIRARTASGQTQIVIFGVSDVNESIQVTGGTANAVLNFPTVLVNTMNLFKNNKLLFKDGAIASIISGNPETYNFAGIGASPWPLTVIVDQKSANTQTVNFVTGDFVNPSAGTAAEVVFAINARLAGATASVASIAGNKFVEITSNNPVDALSAIQITGGTANSVLGFSTSPVLGRSNDYALNRFIGQIELVNPLAPGDTITAGSQFTRAYLQTASPETYTITSGQTLTVAVDGTANQVVTFSTLNNASAATVAAFINQNLRGATARVFPVLGSNFLILESNDQNGGTIEVIGGAGTDATVLDFPRNVIATSQVPTKAYVLSGNPGPYVFVESEQLITIFDQNPANEISQTTMSYPGAVSSSVNTTTVFSDSTYINIFTVTDALDDFWLVMDSGANSTTGNVTSISFVSGNTWQINFTVAPTNFANFATGDHAKITGAVNAANNGNFLITNINTGGPFWIQVTNPNGVSEPSSTAMALLGERRQIFAYNPTGGVITLASALSFAPAQNDAFSIMPYTADNVVLYMNTIQVTQISTLGFVELVLAGNVNGFVQISSQQDGSNGAVQVAGGSANAQFAFTTMQVIGIAAYTYYTGLLALVNTTIYGSDSDPITYPGLGAAGVQFDVQAPTIKEISILLNITLAAGFTISQLSDQIFTAVTGYVNALGIGQEVILSEIVAAVLQIAGIVDVRVVSPLANVPVNPDQVAKTKSSLISFG